MFYSDEEIEEEMKSLEKNQTAFAGITYPTEYLGDREFEILIYFLFKAEIANGIFSGLYDSIKLMKGVAERGRDSVLVKQGKNAGIIECKKRACPLTKPALAKEIIKFLLHFLQDPTLIEEFSGDKYNYYLAVPKGVTEPAQELLTGFSKKISSETDLPEWLLRLSKKIEP